MARRKTKAAKKRAAINLYISVGQWANRAKKAVKDNSK